MKTIYRKIANQPGPKTIGAIECKGFWSWRHTRHSSCGSLEGSFPCPYATDDDTVRIIQCKDGIWRWAITKPGPMQGICEVKLVLDPSVRDLCRLPYPGHPKGCPNFGKKRSCPPHAPPLSELLDLAGPVHAVWVEFNIDKQRRRMWARHPQWSKRQAECCLYWQATVNNRLQDYILSCFVDGGIFAGSHRNMKTVFCPEACGVNVTATMESAGVTLEWPPINRVRKVALVGKSARKE